MLTPDDPRLQSFYDAPGHVLRRARQYNTAGFEREVGHLGITGAQYMALKAIVLQPGMEQQELSNVLFFDAATTGGVVKRLEAMGVVRRQASGRSRRGRALYVTPEGEALIAEAQPLLAKVSEILLSPLTPEEREQFMVLVSRVAGVSNSYNKP